MARVVGVINTSHTPFLYRSPEIWNQVRANRSLRADVPLETLDECLSKKQRIEDGFAGLRAKFHELDPDVAVICGDDQLECFDFSNFPPFAIYVGDDFEGYTYSTHPGRNASPTASLPPRPSSVAVAPSEAPAGMTRIAGHPALATAILTGVMQRGFDPAFCMEVPNPQEGVGHAFLHPADSITGTDTPTIPIFMNCYYSPQPTARRCYDFGKALLQAIEAYPEDLRVVVMGSGGLWHTPGSPQAYLDEEFDRDMLGCLQAGDIDAMARHFDSYRIADDDLSQQIPRRGGPSTGMPALGGPQGGTRETCAWITAAATVESRPFTLVDYIPIYASPIGIGFAYCDPAA